MFFFFKQKTAYEIGTGDWSSDVCSSDLALGEIVALSNVVLKVRQELLTELILIASSLQTRHLRCDGL